MGCREGERRVGGRVYKETGAKLHKPDEHTLKGNSLIMQGRASIFVGKDGSREKIEKGWGGKYEVILFSLLSCHRASVSAASGSAAGQSESEGHVATPAMEPRVQP